jgi:hypothetical protein
LNRPLLTKVRSFLELIAKDGKVNKKKAEELAKSLNRVLKQQDTYDHDQRTTGSHLNPFTPKTPVEGDPIKLKPSELSEPVSRSHDRSLRRRLNPLSTSH